MLKISLSAGHGLNTPGKRTLDGMKEWEFNGVVVKEIMGMLAAYQNVATLRLDHPFGKVDYSLKERTERSDAWGAHVHIDIHANAVNEGWSSASGIETFVYSFADKESKALADRVQQELCTQSGLRSRGVKEGNLHMVREPKAKAKILIEAGFMTNKEDAALLKTYAYRRLVAKAIVDSLVVIYELEPRVAVKSPRYYVKTGTFPTREAAEKFAKSLNVVTHVMEVK